MTYILYFTVSLEWHESGPSVGFHSSCCVSISLHYMTFESHLVGKSFKRKFTTTSVHFCVHTLIWASIALHLT